MKPRNTEPVYVEVEAASEEEAVQKALRSDVDIDNLESWSVHQHIVRGNVFYGEQNEAEATLIDEGG